MGEESNCYGSVVPHMHDPGPVRHHNGLKCVSSHILNNTGGHKNNDPGAQSCAWARGQGSSFIRTPQEHQKAPDCAGLQAAF